MTETEMKVGDTFLICEIFANTNNSGDKELVYHSKEIGIITKICPKRVYFTPTSDEKRFQKGYGNGISHAEVVLPRSEAERLSFLHITYYASSGENLEEYAVRAANVLRERVRRKVREAAKDLKQLIKPVKGIEATTIGKAEEHRGGSADPSSCTPRREIPQQALCLALSDGTVLRAKPNDGFLYPGLSLSIVREGQVEDERMCFVELNPEKQEGHRLYIGVHNAVQAEHVYYKPYHPGTDEEDGNDE